MPIDARSPGTTISSEQPPVRLPTTRTDPLGLPDRLPQLRDEAPIRRLLYADGVIGWLVTGHAEGRAILSDARFSTARDPWRSAVETNIKRYETMIEKMSGNAGTALDAGFFLTKDRPAHTRFRQLLARHFTPRRVNELQTEVEAIFGRQLDAMEEAGPPLDFVAACAMPATSLTICELLGVPYEEHEHFDRRHTAMEDPSSTAEERAAAFDEFADLIRHVIALKRREPGHDLLTELVESSDLGEEELVGVGMFLTSAGHHTTANSLSLGLFALLENREQWDLLCDDTSRIESAVEELLRYAAILQFGASNRTATEDIEIGGVVIRAGEHVSVSLLAANRDPRAYEEPERLDICRDARGHLGFGYGIHMCLGQHLARLELQIGLRALVDRFPSLRIAVPSNGVRMHQGDAEVYGPHVLPVEWEVQG